MDVNLFDKRTRWSGSFQYVPATGGFTRGRAMWRGIRNLTLATAAVLGVYSFAPAALAGSNNLVRPESPLQTTNGILQASLERISRGSALWREAVAAIGKTERHAMVVTTSDAPALDSANGKPFEAWDE